MRRFARHGCVVDLVQNHLDSGRIFLEEFFQLGAEGRVHIACDFGVAELALGLSFELRLRNLDGDNGGETFADIVARNLGFFLALGHVLRKLADNAGEGRLETRHVGAAVIGVYVVHKAEEVFLVAVVVPHGHFERVFPVGHHQVNRFLEQRCAVLVHVADEFGNTARETERVGDLVFGVAFVCQRQTESAHQEGEFAETRGESVVDVHGLAENGVVRVEFDARARIGHIAGADFYLRTAGDAPREFLAHHLAVAAHRHDKLVRECVYATHAYAMEACGHLVGIAVELAARMELGHHHLDGADLFFRVDVRRNAASVVGHADAVARQNGNFDMVAESRESFVYRVVHDFPHQVVQAADVGRADVHGGADADCFKPFEHGNARAAIVFFRLLEFFGGHVFVDVFNGFVVFFSHAFSTYSDKSDIPYDGFAQHRITPFNYSIFLQEQLLFPCGIDRL